MMLRITKSLFAASLLAGCAQPSVAPDPPAEQHKLGALEHWRAVAERRAKVIDNVTPAPQQGHGQTAGSAPAVYIRHGAPDMPFAEAFRPMLAEALRERGHRIVEAPGQAFVIDFDVDTVYYGQGDGLRARQTSAGLGGYPSFLGAVTAGTILAVDAAQEGRWSSGGAAAAAAGSGLAVQMLQKVTDTTNTEVLLTLDVLHDGETIHTHTEPYYIAAPDRALYWSRFSDPPSYARAANDDRRARAVSFRITR